MPAMSAPQGWLLGGEFLLKGLVALPFALFFSPFLALAPLTNIVFWSNLVRLFSVGSSTPKPPSDVWVGIAFLFNCIALLLGGTSKTNVLGDIGRYPAMWLWLLSFVLLCMAITRSERGALGTPEVTLKDRWKLAVALSFVFAIAGLTARAVKFPGPVIKRSVPMVDGIEIRRTGVPPGRLPLLEDGYLRTSNYKFFVLDGYTHEPTPGGGWIARPGATPVKRVVHEAVESYRTGPEGPGEVLRSSISIHDGAEVIARKSIYRGMTEDGHGWVGAIALKFVQTVLQPAPGTPSNVRRRTELFADPLDLPSATELVATRRTVRGCPGSVALNNRDWKQLRTPHWNLQALMNILEVACSRDSVLVVMGNKSGIHLDVIGFNGQVVLQARASVSRPTDDYLVEEVYESKTGWRIRVVGYSPGPSINLSRIPVERFEIAIDLK